MKSFQWKQAATPATARPQASPWPLARLLSFGLLVVVLQAGCGKSQHHHETMAGGTAAKGSLYDLELSFTDQAHRARPVRSLSGAPVVLSLIYTRCDSICPMMAGNMVSIQRSLSPELRARTRFVLVSFDSGDTPADLAAFATRLKLDERWSLLRGSEDSVRQLSAALGFQYRRNPDGNFSHSASIYVLNERGEVVFKRDGTAAATEEFRARIRAL